MEISVIETDPDGSPSRLVSVDLPDVRIRRKYYRLLNLLSDLDILDSVGLELPRGQKGSWVTFPMHDRQVVAQFDKGRPEFWTQGLFLGSLHVARVLTRDNFVRLIEEGQSF